MKVFEQRRRQLEEMASVLEENKKLQASVLDYDSYNYLYYFRNSVQ